MLRPVLAAAVLAAAAPAFASDTPDPARVVVAGSFQEELGCPGDWQPGCEATGLAFDADDAVWQRTFDVPAGGWEYKATLNGSWDENYGAGAQQNGPNLALTLADAAPVKFYYDHETHWVTSGRNTRIAVAPGSFQSELGCASDWDPGCLRSWLQDPDGDGVFTFTTTKLPAGDYEAKVAIGESWSENYGAGGQANGPNIPFTVPSDCASMRFVFDGATNVLTVEAAASPPPQPSSVTLAGSLQSELGCPGDWQPDCAATHLVFDAEDGVWQRRFDVPAGDWEYKAPVNDSWDENYGANGQRNGANIPLSLSDPASVKFYFDYGTKWITSDRNAVIATVPGSFQSELGCAGDWDPSCLRSWLQDVDGDGIYTFSTASLPAGNYEAKVAVGESWSENYGEGGVPNGPNIAFTVPAACAETTFRWDSATKVLTVAAGSGPKGNLNLARAHWVAADLLAWNPSVPADGTTFALHYAADGGLSLETGGVAGGETFVLTRDPAGLPDSVKARFPHLASFNALRLDTDVLLRVPEILKGQTAVSATGADAVLTDATSIQIPGVLDDLFFYDGTLGVSLSGGVPTLRVWAPTAKSVRLHLFADSNPATSATVIPMTADPSTGVWSAVGSPDWMGRFYLYEVRVWVRQTGQVETNLVTDPYSVSLSRNSARSQIVDLDDPRLKPEGWDGLRKPPLAAPEDIVLYELHVRDFSASDPTVPPAKRGTFAAFALPSTAGTRHLSALARAGFTHVHLLPAFDIATIDEDKSAWLEPVGDLESYPPDSPMQQEAVGAVRGADAFNWGYDPWHFNVPEGSYATDPDGPARVREFRDMVQGLANRGLRVVMDVVYNHTNASGQNAKSVFDRIVPGYYHRLDGNGNVERSSCCENTASEHLMFEKFVVDSTVFWAREYKVDGFRFDLMGHHMKSNLEKVRDALHALTPGRDGVDGASLYVYGEGWNFGEVANNARGVNAVQINMAGTGIGTFNDRLRDGVRGGGPFSPLEWQGFATGLYTDPNGVTPGDAAGQKAWLLQMSDWIRSGLAGSLADYPLVNAQGDFVPASAIDYNGQPAGYTDDPQEVIHYVSAHDNETIFDAVLLKAPEAATLADRIRMKNLATSVVAFAQGIPFFHAGDEILRSKSLDRNSYDSGDWFNRLDFTYTTNNFGVGLPPAWDNESNWPVMAPVLADARLKPSRPEILASFAHALESVAIRRSTALFRMRTAAEIASGVTFHNTGPEQVPGLVVMELRSTASPATVAARRERHAGRATAAVTAARALRPVGDGYERAVVLFNADDRPVSFAGASFRGASLKLHPVQKGSVDPVVRTASFDASTGTFLVPGRTAAVFVCCGGPDAIVIRPPVR